MYIHPENNFFAPDADNKVPVSLGSKVFVACSETIIYDTCELDVSSFNPKKHGGGRILPIGKEIACHFSQDHTMVTKFLDFIHTHPIKKVVKLVFYYLDRFSKNLAKTDRRL